MSSQQSQPLFTEGFSKRVHDADDRNRKEGSDVYHHPRSQRIVRKCIDLTCRKPLHAVGEHPGSHSEERWLEAYLIYQAKKNDWVLRLVGREYRLLFSQLKFRRTETDNAVPLDLLVWDKKEQHLVVLELKAGKHGRRLEEAKVELDKYTKEINRIKEEIAEVFHLGSVLGVRGYIIWPSDAKGKKPNLGDWGLIEYPWVPEPWDKFKETEGKLIIDFKLVKPAGGRICESTK